MGEVIRPDGIWGRNEPKPAARGIRDEAREDHGRVTEQSMVLRMPSGPNPLVEGAVMTFAQVAARFFGDTPAEAERHRQVNLKMIEILDGVVNGAQPGGTAT